MLFLLEEPPHPATLAEESLLKRCTVHFGRHGGPGGQHRNKVETSVHIVHEPTGIDAQAGERRKQYENRAAAVRRLRLRLAREVRTRVNRRRDEPSELWRSRRQGTQLSINPRHRDYPALLAEGLDVLFAFRFDAANAAGWLGISMSQLAKLVRHDKRAFVIVNEERERRGLPPLK